jgi:hypothetical protein
MALLERRAAPRVSLPCACVAFTPGTGEVSGLVQDISRVGVGVVLAGVLPAGEKIFLRRPSRYDARLLYATVVRVAPVGDYCFHGCSIGIPLGEVELQRWLA